MPRKGRNNDLTANVTQNKPPRKTLVVIEFAERVSKKFPKL